jgi:outer membrane protein assembly factor BamB
MKYLFHQKKYGVIFVCCFCILLSVNAFAETAPWPMFLHDSSHTGRSALPGPSSGDILWAFPITAENPSSPIVGPDGTVYVGSETGLYAVNPNGTQKWKFATGRQIISSPAIDMNGIVYFGCLDSKIYAIYPDGSRKWSELTGGEIHSSPLITSDGLIVTGASDGSVYAYLSTGTLKWKYTPVGESDWVYASPAIGPDGTLYVATNKGVLALDISGATPTRKWFHPVITSYLKSSPAVGSDGSIYIGTRDNTLLSLKSDGSVRWTYSILGDIRSSPVIGPDGTIHIANISITDSSARFLYAINPNGTNKWSSPTGANVFDQSPAVDSNGVVYIGCADNFVHAIDTGGAEIWRFPGQGGPFSSIAIGKNQTLYFVATGGGGYKGYLYAVGPSPPSSPIWPMFRYNSFHTGKSPSMGPTTDNLKWSVDTGTFSVNPANNELFSSPAIDASGTVYIGGSSLKAYYPDGTLKWEFNSESSPFMSSPAIGNNGIIYAAELVGRLYALDPTTGHEITRCGITNLIYSSPVIGPDGIIYIGSTDVGLTSGKVHAIYPETKPMTEIWTSATGGPVSSSPAIGLDGSIYVGSTDGVLYTFNSPDGSLKWKYPSSGASTLGAIKSSPAVDRSGYIYFGTADRVVALNPDGSFYWEYIQGTAFDSSPAISQDGLVVIGTIGGYIKAFESDGNMRWAYGCGGVLSSPVVGADGLIYFGDTNGKIFALKPDGTEQWVYDAGPTNSSSSPAIGLYKTLYIGSRDTTSEKYKLYAFATPSAFIKLPAAYRQTNSVNAYRMIGIPVMPTDSDTFNSLKTYWGGVYDPLSWRLFAYTSGAYTEISASGQDSISPGKGWFIISANEKQIEIPGAILATDFLKSVGTGYILLACPFQDESVAWTTVVNGNTPLLLGANLYYWDGSGNYAVAPNMEPGKSYFAWIGNAAGGTLLIKRHSATATFASISNHSSMLQEGAFIAEPSRQPPPPLAPGAFIHVSSPNGKENWIGGEQHQITWNSLGISPEGFVSTVDIALSWDGGNTYEVLKKQYSNSGYYNWRIPNGTTSDGCLTKIITSDRCLIKITSSLYSGTSDVSDTFFSIR